MVFLITIITNTRDIVNTICSYYDLRFFVIIATKCVYTIIGMITIDVAYCIFFLPQIVNILYIILHFLPSPDIVYMHPSHPPRGTMVAAVAAVMPLSNCRRLSFCCVLIKLYRSTFIDFLPSDNFSCYTKSGWSWRLYIFCES